MKNSLKKEIYIAVVNAYKNAASPKFFFISERNATKPYDEVINEIRKIYAVTDMTDFNWDSGYNLSVKDASGKILGISISLVGKYGYLITGKRHATRFILDSSDCVDEFESSVLRILNGKGIKMLSFDDLAQRLPFLLRNTDFESGESDLVFNLLFSRIRLEDNFNMHINKDRRLG